MLGRIESPIFFPSTNQAFEYCWARYKRYEAHSHLEFHVGQLLPTGLPSKKYEMAVCLKMGNSPYRQTLYIYMET